MTFQKLSSKTPTPTLNNGTTTTIISIIFQST